jgi:hypothetical protein
MSDASQTRQILTPLSGCSPVPSICDVFSRKRKRDEDPFAINEDLLKDCFTVKVLSAMSHPSSNS